MMRLPARLTPRLLWIDSGAACLAGLTVLSLSGWLSRLHALPRGLLIAMGAANLAYAAYSGSLAIRARRPRLAIVALVVANALWAVLCAVLAVRFAATASGFGLAHLIGEGLFVGGLAGLEWSQRERLATAA
jgi:hypothetical protein